jgi:Fur family ferric uptake transcriptional regulator
LPRKRIVREKTLPTQRNTKQKNLILDYLKSSGVKHFTADEMIDALKNAGTPVAKSTAYRFLSSLEETGDVRKYLLSEGSPACYQYIGRDDEHREQYHLMCRECGSVIHFENSELGRMFRDIGASQGEKGFRIDGCQTVFYGVCGSCSAKAKKKK